MFNCLAIYREITNSPNRETDDALILRDVATELKKLGAKVKLLQPENLALINPAKWDVVVAMCENLPALKTIEPWQKNTIFVNTIDAVFNCYRTNMTPLMQSCNHLHPPTEIRYTKDLTGKPPAFFGRKGVWIKRGDVHNQCNNDVVFVKNWQTCKKIQKDFHRREIQTVCIQKHIDGDLVKFYAVGPLKWFDWFYHKPDESKKYKFSERKLEVCAATVAQKVGLEVYGGDAIVTSAGNIYIIDINSWPSFAKVREKVKYPIAKHIFDKAESKLLLKKGN